MKIFVDENIPLMTVQALRADGHDVLDIRGTPDEGMDDETLWKTIQREGRLLITTDKGFAQHRNSSHCGILIVRLRQPNRQKNPPTDNECNSSVQSRKLVWFFGRYSGCSSKFMAI
jgi:predicted nuclease of predicted toxin-antitoxin system